MARQTQKMFNARLILSKTELSELWDIHTLFNRKLSDFIRLLMRCTSGKSGETPEEREFYRDFVSFVLAADAKNAKYLFNGVSLENWVPNTANKLKVELTDSDGTAREVTGETVTGRALDMLKKGKRLFVKDELFSGLPRWAGEFILSDAVAFFSGYRAQIQRWETERAAWEQKKQKWEEDNSDYMKVRPRLVEFHQQEGAATLSSRRLRWHKYMDFFESNPQLAAWRGKSDPVVRPLDEAGLEIVKKAFQNEKAAKKLQAFFRVNPELKALDVKHAEYEKEFTPRRKKLASGKIIQTDGFKLRPRLTLPDAARHPRFLYLNGEQTAPTGYRRLVLPGKKAGTVEINVATDSTKSEWKSFSFRGDDRFWQIQQEIIDVEVKKRAVAAETEIDPENSEKTAAEETNGGKPATIKKKIVYNYNDLHLDAVFSAEIKSARLRFITDRQGQPRRAYLEFSVKRDCREMNEKAAAVKFVPVKRGDREWKQLTFAEDTKIALFHLGITSACYAALVTGEQGKPPVVLDSRRLWLSHYDDIAGKWKGEPKLEDILRHDRELRSKASSRSKFVKGETSDAALRKHIRLMENDRYKKTARRIIDYALNKDERQFKQGEIRLPEADIIIIGDFSGVGSSGKNPRSLNRLINLWKRPQIITLVKDMAAEAGIKVLEASSWGGSQVCSRCGSVGRRYMITPGRDNHPSEIRFNDFGRHFACSSCGHRDNSEKNAVFNLANTLFTKGAHFERFREFLKLTPQEKFAALREAEDNLLTGPKSIKKAIAV